MAAAGTPDMANGAGFDPLSSWARLSERVENQGKDIVDLRSNMNSGFQGVNTAINALSNELRSNSRTPWPVIWSAIGVSFAILGYVGSQALSPIKEAVSITQSDLRLISERMITRQEMDWRAARGVEDRQRIETAISAIRSDLVPRGEHAQETAADSQRFADFQRQIDDLKRLRTAP